MKLIANETIETGRGEDQRHAPGAEFDMADEKEAAALIARGAAKAPEAKAKTDKEPKK